MLMSGQHTLLETALKNQDKIGWNYALQGYLSTSWVDTVLTNNHMTAFDSCGYAPS
jgi:hypothetical protein